MKLRILWADEEEYFFFISFPQYLSEVVVDICGSNLTFNYTGKAIYVYFNMYSF